ncbi:MAG TPA: MFS transporter [Acidimicrobiia bacterium]|nr:MFS transporter [Acidimicrobiia bacterium]
MLSLCVVVIGVDNTILNVAIPSIVRSLDASGSQLQWMVDAYTIVFACLLLTAGSLGDRYGRRRTLMFGLAWFGVFSALASTASSPSMLIGARALMGVGGAFIFPTTLSILTNTFRDPAERARAIGVWAGVAGIGIAIGPVVGGLLVEHLGWGSVFLINVPVCTITFVLARWLVPNTSAPEESPLDPIGALLSIAGLVGLLFAIIEVPNHGWTAPDVLAGFAIGLVFLAAFAAWETHTPRPMLDVRFFRNPRFSAASATITLAYFALFASTFLLTQYFQFVLGYSPLESGLMLTPVALGLMVGSPSAPRFVHRFGTKRVVVFGLLVVAAAMACYASDTIMSSFALGFGVRLVYGIGMGVTVSPVTESIMGSLPPGRAGVGSAVNDTTRQTGGALGVAVLGSIFASQYHATWDAARGVSPAVVHSARDSIGTSLQVAKHLPAGVATQVEAVATDAFLSSMRITYTCAVAVVLGAVFVAARFLPARAREPETHDDHELAEALALGAENAAN